MEKMIEKENTNSSNEDFLIKLLIKEWIEDKMTGWITTVF